jgi:hypothetical protein
VRAGASQFLSPDGEDYHRRTPCNEASRTLASGSGWAAAGFASAILFDAGRDRRVTIVSRWDDQKGSTPTRDIALGQVGSIFRRPFNVPTVRHQKGTVRREQHGRVT